MPGSVRPSRSASSDTTLSLSSRVTWSRVSTCAPACIKSATVRPSLPRRKQSGGAIGLGHPLGATGTRLIQTVLIELGKRVSPTCLISFERNRYSVPASFANRPVSLRVYPDRLVVAAEGNILCEHVRVIQRSHHLPAKTIYDWRHYLAVVQRKPGALRNGAPFAELPLPFQRLQRQLLRHSGGDRVMAQVLMGVSLHGLEAVVVAVELALQSGRVSAEHVLNVIARLKEPAPARLEISTPLQLNTPALANLERYDALRDEQEARHE